ncbi:MAG: TonB-dependent receptor plug domain-containing protein, partial [Prolixibacteraceae bacterium]|nr:TonB-dependent receptor plug domain-containing protein [Prolixibacteraceae bacterium]
MKLRTGKSSFIKRNKHICVLLFFIVFLFPVKVYSQTFTFTFKDAPVSKALTEIAQNLEIRIAFDAGELQKLKLSKTIEETSIVAILKSVLEGTGYDIRYMHNTYLVIKNEEFSKIADFSKKTISGIVFDKETGERLPYASVFFSGRNFSIPATVDGTFSVEIYDSVSSIIQVRYLGYFPCDTIIPSSFENNFLKIGLRKKVHTLDPVNITENKIDIIEVSNEAGHLTFNPARFSDLPNYGETDVFRALQMIPGISWQENSAQLNIRGSSADQNLVTYDGFTLYNLDHFFGVFSALNPNVIKNIQVFRGGFDSHYGERISGIVDITGKTGSQQKPQFYGGINLISANLTAEIPVSKKITLVAAGRRAFSDIYSSW